MQRRAYRHGPHMLIAYRHGPHMLIAYRHGPHMLIAYRHGPHIRHMLIDHGAHTNFQESNGDTALMTACDEGHLDTARVLI